MPRLFFRPQSHLQQSESAGPRVRSVRRSVLPLLSLLVLAPACESKGGQDTSPPRDASAVQDLSATRDLAGPAPLLASYAGCAAELFASGTAPQDFSSPAAFAAAWKASWAQPQVKGGSLAFGPHPLSADWWENYSPAASLDKPGDILLCARLRLTTQTSDPAVDNSFELTMRNPDGAMYETSGMVLLVEGNASFVALRTRTGPDTWTTYERKPLSMESGKESAYELLLFGKDQRFVAEIKNVATGQITQLHAEAALPAGGAVTMVGWRTRSGIFVDKLVLGAPSQAAAAVLVPALTP